MSKESTKVTFHVIYVLKAKFKQSITYLYNKLTMEEIRSEIYFLLFDIKSKIFLVELSRKFLIMTCEHKCSQVINIYI